MPPSEEGGRSIRQRAAEATGSGDAPSVTPSAAVDAREGLFDQTWDNQDLEAALEEREATRAARLQANADHKIKDDIVKALLSNYSLAVGEVARIGRFRIKKIAVKGGTEVSFTTTSREQLQIGADNVDAEGED